MNAKNQKLFLLTEEELERFDHMLTALGQAYWALMRNRSVNMPKTFTPKKLNEEEKFYQLHFDFNEEIDTIL